MAIIACPNCGKSTSSKADNCLACGMRLAAGDHERQARTAARARREQKRRMTSQAVLATLLGVTGGLWLIFGDAPRQGGMARAISLGMLIGGLIWYLYLRARLWINRLR